MRREEAVLLAEWVRELRLPEGAVCLNIGSSTGEFREQQQPHRCAFLMLGGANVIELHRHDGAWIRAGVSVMWDR